MEDIMSDNRPIDEHDVDRREETRITEEPGYVVRERVVHDHAAERRLRIHRTTQLIWTFVSILLIILGLRFVLRLIGANPQAPFSAFLYGLTSLFLAPFAALFAEPQLNGMVFETTTLIAMGVYALFTWVVVRLIGVLAYRTGARTMMRTTHEEASVEDELGPRHDERTTRSTRRD
jgi:YggT family protein